MQKNEETILEKREKEVKKLSPKLDVVFQGLFGEVGDEEVTKDLLEAILKEKIYKIDLSKNVILREEMPEDKLGILDVLVEINDNEKCNIEMQVINKTGMIERILFYWSRVYSKQIQSGNEYKNLKKTIVILIADYKIAGLENLGYHTVWHITEDLTHTPLTNKQEIHIIELPKAKKLKNVNDVLLNWTNFLENPNSEKVKEIMKEHKAVKIASEKLTRISEDEKMQRIAELREKAIRDEKATYSKGIADRNTKTECKNGIQERDTRTECKKVKKRQY